MKPKTLEIDQEKSEKFSQRMLERLNGAALMLMTSIGHRTGLFDKMDGMGPATSEVIAKAAGLNERYVREALGVYVTGGVVEYDSQERTYVLPAEHAAWLTRRASPGNLAVTSQWISVLGKVEDVIVECFRKGGGLTYEKYDRFHEVMAEESHQTVVLPLIEHLIPLVPGLKERLHEGIQVLDAGCGSGYALVHLARNFPNSRFTGYDLCEAAIERARQEAREHELSNIRFEVRDAASSIEGGPFDLITTFDAVHDQADPAGLLRNIYGALKSDGIYLMQEISGSSRVDEDKNHPLGAFLYTISCMHCMSVSLGRDGAGLGAMWGRETALRMIREAGFSKAGVQNLDHDPINDYYVIRK